MTFTPEEIAAGQAIYTPKLLSIYDLLVLGLSNRFIWKCPTPRQLAHYDRHVSANHLDVGVGTGYFLDRCLFPVTAPRVALMDINAQFARLRRAPHRPLQAGDLCAQRAGEDRLRGRALRLGGPRIISFTACPAT